ncbi:MAG: ATP-dependent DNA helicase RecG [Candidatus Omnitrophota bacterium]
MYTESIRYLKGVGPKKEEVFKKVGVSTVGDILRYFPFRYEDRRNLKKIKDLKEDEFAVVKGKVIARHLKKIPYFVRATRVRNILEIAVSDSSGVLLCTWFNQGYLYDSIQPDSTLIIYGKPKKYEGKMKIVAPEFEVFEEDSESLNLGRIVSVYPTTRFLNQKFIRKTVSFALGLMKTKLVDPLPFDIRTKKNLPNIVKSFEGMHFPNTFEEADNSRERFIFEELFFSQILVYLRKAKHRMQKSTVLKVKDEFISKLKSNLGFMLTPSQEMVLNEILVSLAQPYPMHRLLQGDVGCGKTVVCAFGFGVCVDNGYQAAFMVPTEILAFQHKETFEKFFQGLGYRIEVLVSSLPPKEIERIHKDLKDGKVDIVIGTHSLIEERIEFKNLTFVAIDEQHKFGVAQRALLPEKGMNPHYLVMSATPIPRSLALSLYGDLDLSIIKDLPKGRIIPKTIWVKEEKRAWVYDFIKSKLKEGRQGYIIYPIIEESQDEDLKSLEIMSKEIKKEFAPYKIGIFHGRLKFQDKLSVVKKFQAKEIDLLISTTVVEVGVNIENATIMLVENPERFGLAQLHQLRGRIQRASFEPHFIILSKDELAEDVCRRLKVIVATSDGFEIAEEDLNLRGPGDFFGQMQHGLPDLRIANPLRDMEVLKEARAFAYEVIKEDPCLEKQNHRTIRDHLDFWFNSNADLSLNK